LTVLPPSRLPFLLIYIMFLVSQIKDNFDLITNSRTMISAKDAIEKIKLEINSLGEKRSLVEDALDHVLANNILSPINMPPFAQSAMDGYAVNDSGSHFEVVAEIQAGDSAAGIKLEKGQASRIFTGAMVPKGVFAVVKQEDVERTNNNIVITHPVKEMQNIRPLGEQIEKSEVALKQGTVVSAGSAGFLYTLGIDTIDIIRKPKVVIIATGNELIPPGQELTPGKIYESNTYTIKTALRKIGVDAVIKTVKDDYESTKEIIKASIEESDLLITTGGISVGDYDYVGKAFLDLGVESIFYKVKQKPGKPIFFGKKGETAIFGLPGNPAAALSCFYLYVTPAIRKMSGFTDLFLEKRTLKITSSYKKTKNLSHFLKARYFEDEVTILNAQSSAMLSSFAEANCLVHMIEEQESWEAGDEVNAYVLP